MMIEQIKLVQAKKKFKIKDGFEFIEFDDVSKEVARPEGAIPDTFEVWAAIKLDYEGQIPDSYRTLNMAIWDWVDDHKKELADVIHDQLRKHLEDYYPQAISDLNGEETAIWEDQLDYMPRIDEDRDTIIIEVELVMTAEPIDQD